MYRFYSHYGELYGMLVSPTMVIWPSIIKAVFYAGTNSQTMKLHLISHYVEVVRRWGPLWAYGCFPFESVNKQITKMFHGTRDMSRGVRWQADDRYSKHLFSSPTTHIRILVHPQVAFSFTLMQLLPVWKSMQYMSPVAEAFLDKLTGQKYTLL